MRRAIASSWRRLAASESSRLAKVLVGELRQIATGGLQPAIGVQSHPFRHVLLSAMEAGRYAIWT